MAETNRYKSPEGCCSADYNLLDVVLVILLMWADGKLEHKKNSGEPYSRAELTEPNSFHSNIYPIFYLHESFNGPIKSFTNTSKSLFCCSYSTCMSLPRVPIYLTAAANRQDPCLFNSIAASESAAHCLQWPRSRKLGWRGRSWHHSENRQRSSRTWCEVCGNALG